mgnify:CR=1 FL=1|jgi:hypothetical protein
MNNPPDLSQAGRLLIRRYLAGPVLAGIAELPILARSIVNGCAVAEDEIENEIRDGAINSMVAAGFTCRPLGFDSLENRLD